MFNISKVDVKIKVNEKLTQVNIKSLKLYNIKLHEQQDKSMD